MLTEAGVGVVVEGGGLNTAAGYGAVVVEPPKQNHQSQIGTVTQLRSGGLAGAFSKACTAPLARLTILFQGMHSDGASLRKANNKWHEASWILGEEGFCAFWKGNLVKMTHRLPYFSVSFYAFERY